MNPRQCPVWGAAFLPPESTAELAGSTATTLTLGFLAFSASPTPVIVHQFPLPRQKFPPFIRVAPDLFSGRRAVYFGIGRVLELHRHKAA